MSSNDNNSQQQFTIQPHPATTNDPRDLQRELAGGGPQGGAANIFNTPGVAVPSAETAASLEKPKSREELEAEFKKLNG